MWILRHCGAQDPLTLHSRDLSEASFVKAGHARARDLRGMAAD
jgi:hypothetical protein